MRALYLDDSVPTQISDVFFIDAEEVSAIGKRKEYHTMWLPGIQCSCRAEISKNSNLSAFFSFRIFQILT